MAKRTQLAPAKRAIIIGMDGASMELVKNMIDWGTHPEYGEIAPNRRLPTDDWRIPDLDTARVDCALYWFMARHP